MADEERPRMAGEWHAAKVIAGEVGDQLAAARIGGLDMALRHDGAAMWVVLKRKDHGGLALRMPVPGRNQCARLADEPDAMVSAEIVSDAGRARLVLRADPFGLEQLKVTLGFAADHEVQLDPAPRDLVPFDEHGRPGTAHANIEASQRHFNTALLYFSVDKPQFGKVLYLQDLTGLNSWFNATGTSPENVVGGQWPDVGYSPPVPLVTRTAVLPKGTEVTLYDTILTVRRFPRTEEADSAWQFLDMLGAIYPLLSRPTPRYRDWVERARHTVHDLTHAPEARISHYGLDYFHPYVASEYPDCMVQLTLGSALHEWGEWLGEEQPLEIEVLKGIHKFFDEDLGILRRYLPDVGPDKDRNEVDSWYLYHPLLNLANLALGGRQEARRLFLASLDYAVNCARHFDYIWPVMFDIRDFRVIREVAEADQRGQTDVGGLYAWVMLQAFELTGSDTFLKEAEKAIEKAQGMRFDLNYQANLTAWGAAACIRLWRITNRKQLLTQSYVYLASFFHNCQLWESEMGNARFYSNFLGATCLQDARYMAAYECFDSYAALERYLDLGGPDLIPAARLLVGEYCAHALSRAWYYYPDALPADMLCQKPRNGYIVNSLNFPLEDLYSNGEEAGQVGQEIYGAGAALVFATRAFRRIEDAPFLLYCSHFLRAFHRYDDATIGFHIDGDEGSIARLFLRTGDPDAFAPRLRTGAGETIPFERTFRGWEARLPASAALNLSWVRPS